MECVNPLGGGDNYVLENIMEGEITKIAIDGKSYWEKDKEGNWHLVHPGIEVPTVDPLW